MFVDQLAADAPRILTVTEFFVREVLQNLEAQVAKREPRKDLHKWRE